MGCKEESSPHLTSSSATQSTGSNNNHHHFNFPHLGKMNNSMRSPLRHSQFHLHWKKGRGHETQRDVPKGCVAVCVGQEEAEQQRFVIRVEHMNHPLFEELLKEAEEEYGFEQKGIIHIPCHVWDFKRVHDLVYRDRHDSHVHRTCFH